MRTLWIALLIALLPLRGWVGDAMAVAMVSTAPHLATAVAAADDCPHGSAQAADHGSAVASGVADTTAHHATGHGQAESAATDDAHGDAGAHLLCDVCNGPVLSSAALSTPGAVFGHGLRIARSEAFASLAPRHLIKPPIA